MLLKPRGGVLVGSLAPSSIKRIMSKSWSIQFWSWSRNNVLHCLRMFGLGLCRSGWRMSHSWLWNVCRHPTETFKVGVFTKDVT